MMKQVLNIDKPLRETFLDKGKYTGTVKTPRFLTTYNGEKYILKCGARNARNEWEGSILLQSFRINCPDVILVLEKNVTVACLIKWLENTSTLNVAMRFIPISEEICFELLKIFLFDGVVGNWDRHGNNILIDVHKSIVYAVDNEDIFYSRSYFLRVSKQVRQMMKHYLLQDKFMERAVRYVEFLKEVEVDAVIVGGFKQRLKNVGVVFQNLLSQFK